MFVRRTTWAALTVAAGMVVAMSTPASGLATAAQPLAPTPSPTALAAASADRLVAGNAALVHASALDKIHRVNVTSSLGLQYVAYDRTYAGLPVFGGDFVVVTDHLGKVLSTTIGQDKTLSVATTPTVSAAAAAATARAEVARVTSVSPTRLTVMATGTGRLAYETLVEGSTAAGAPSRMRVFVDAHTGAVVESYEEVFAGTGNSFYNGTVTISTSGSGSSWAMSDPTRPGIRCGGQDGNTFTGTDDVWGNGSGTSLETACVDALFGVQKEWDMLGQWLGRNGINGTGGGFPARVGLNQVNAFWNGSNTNFGHSSDNLRQATPMDVVAHEYGHAIFQTTPGGSSGGTGTEKGGLNESTGDIFGALTEHFVNEPSTLDPPDYLVGEEVNLTGSGPIRNMFNPSALGDPNCFSSAIPSTEVHAAAGPQNHWFYLLAEGSNPGNGKPTSPTCNGSTVVGIGVQKAGQIFMGGLNRKITNWSHAAARSATIAAANQLFPGSATECNTVKAAWSAVSVGPVSGEQACSGGGGGTTVFSDDFELARGWTTNPNGTDTATTGAWQRGDPAQTTSGTTICQLGTTTSGVNDLVTGATAGSSVGANDLDGGTTTVQSPAITLPSTGTLTLSFNWYLGHLNNSSTADFVRVRVVGSSANTVVFQQLGAATNRSAAWATASANISTFAGQSVRIVVEAADASTASLVEAGVDDVRITQG